MLLNEKDRQWKNIKGTGYDISNDGLVRKMSNLRNGIKPGYLMKPHASQAKYRSFGYCLTSGKAKYKRYTVNKLVKEYFGHDLEVSIKWLDAVIKYIQEENKKHVSEKVSKKVNKKVDPYRRRCRECGRSLPSGYWRLCPGCLRKLETFGDQLRITGV